MVCKLHPQPLHAPTATQAVAAEVLELRQKVAVQVSAYGVISGVSITLG